jgi:uncharacterized membrane protein
LLAVFWLEAGRADAAALALAGGIALKSFPVLLLPFFLLSVPGSRPRLRFLALATLPVVALLVPFALDDPAALRRELLGYGGVADFGWIGLVRAVRWLRTGVLARSEAAHWPTLVPLGKAGFLATLALLFAFVAARRLRFSMDTVALAVFLAFLTLYGAVSAQYLLWVVPFGVLVPDRFGALYAAAGTLALLGFYPFLAPGVLYDAAGPSPGAGTLWALGTGAVLAASGAWLVATVARGRRAARVP